MIEYAFDKMRNSQIELIDKVVAAFEQKKYVILEAPTGLGKSAIVMSVALHLRNSYINTSTKLLQDQYLNDFQFVNTIKGKSNFPCVYDKSGLRLTCDNGKCCQSNEFICPNKPKKENFVIFNHGMKNQRIMQKPLNDIQGKEIESCRYYTQKLAGFASAHTIMNYTYFFSLFFYTDQLESRNLLVFDEAHNIENQILDFISLYPNPVRYQKIFQDLDPFLKKNIKLPIFPNNDKFEDWLDYLKATRSWTDSAVHWYKDNGEKVAIPPTFAELESVNKKLSHITSLMETHRENWIIDVKMDLMGKLKTVKISPIETGEYVKPIFDIGEKVLLVSATILDKEVFASMIGIPLSDIEFIRVENSPFPVQNRPIYLKNVGDMNYKTMDGLMPKIVDEIDGILEKHQHERGIIHTTSYKQLDFIVKNSLYKRRLIKTETGISQSIALQKAAVLKDAVLISPSMHEGIDLKDDLSRFQIVIKIPYLDLSDKRTMVKKNKSPKWYQYHAILKLIQAIGRSIRNEQDHATTYILDSKAGYMIYNSMVPKYIKQAVQRK